MSLPHALLGLLAVEPRSGYELTKAFEGYLGQYAWGAGHTSIYPELGKLLDAGLVSVTAEGARGSRTYAVTDEGRADLREWMFNRPKNRKVRNEDVLRMFLISALDHDDAVSYLRRLAGMLGEQLEDLREFRSRSGPVSQTGSAGFGLLAAEYGLRQLEATHGWAEWAIEQLEEAGEREPAGASSGE